MSGVERCGQEWGRKKCRKSVRDVDWKEIEKEIGLSNDEIG